MNCSKSNNANVKLMSSLVDPRDAIEPEDSYYRFLVDGRDIKYVNVAPGTLGGEEIDWTFGSILLSELLPPFPPGDWNQGHVAKDPQTGEVAFIKTENLCFAGVDNLWHPVRLEELDFKVQTTVRQRVYISSHPKFNGGKPVMIKMAVWSWEIAYMENETRIYECIHGKGIGPNFLGHLIEGKDSGGRVVGFVVELVQDARNAGPEDLESCSKVLKRLHELGIKHGDINRFNFLVREGHEVILIDFEASAKCASQELEEEMSALKASLEDPSFLGGVVKVDCE